MSFPIRSKGQKLVNQTASIPNYATKARLRQPTQVGIEPVRFIRFVRLGYVVLGLLCLLVQQAFAFEDPTNTLASLIIFASCCHAAWYCLRPSLLSEFTLSTIALLGYNFTTLTGALMFQTLGMRPVTLYLNVPIETFSMLAIAQGCYTIGHWIYRKIAIFPTISSGVSQTILHPLGAFTIPSNLHLWMLGGTGLVATTITSLFLDERALFQGPIGKFFQAFSGLIYLPFLIPLLRYFEPTGSRLRSNNWVFLTVYFLAICALGVARNSRAIIFLTLVVLCTVWALALLTGRARLPNKLGKYVVIALIFGGIGISILADIATAMVVARRHRGNVPFTELIGITAEKFFDKEALAARRSGDEARGDSINYNEAYFASPLLDRIVLTKFHDNMFYYGGMLSETGQSRLAELTLNKTISILPDPAIRLFQPDFKKLLYRPSMGDFTYYLVYKQGLGHFRTGSLVQNVFAIFGNWALAVFSGLFLLFSIIIESYRNWRKSGLLFAPAILISLLAAVTCLASESIAAYVLYLFRILPQTLLIYCSLFWILRTFLPYDSKLRP